jgi:hypothetical protein
MKQISFGFAFISCAVLSSLLTVSCSKKDGALNLQSMTDPTSSEANKPSPPPPPPANPVIAYVVPGKFPVRNIMVMNADGSNQTVIVNGTMSTVGGLSWAPTSSLNPNVNHIAYEQGNNTGIRIVDVSVVNGKPTASNDHQLSGLGGLSGITSPKWSPVGNQIAFGAGDSNSSNIYLLPAGGGIPVMVYTAPGGYICTDYAWSSDGSKLFINEMTAAGPILNNVRELDLNTHTTYTLIQDDPVGWNNTTCSPDGLRIAYSAPPAIYYVTADFSTLPVTIGSPHKVVDGGSPSWSPDNSMLLFEGGTTKGINYSPGGEYTYTFSNGTIKNISADGLWSDWRR